MKDYRLITSDHTLEFCYRVSEVLINGQKLYGEPKMTFDKKRSIIRCGQVFLKTLKKNIQKNQFIPNIRKNINEKT